MTVETWPLDRIRPYERNARKIPKAAVDKVAASLREFGWRQPIVVDEDGVILVGHVRRLAALQNGYTEAPVHLATGLTPAQCRAYRLADNRSHDEAGWDKSLLGIELSGLADLSFDLSLTGFGDAEIGRLMPATAAEPEAQMDRAEELQAKWRTDRGQVWTVGPHRLACADSTDLDAVQDLTAGDVVTVVFTDPPYGVDFERGKYQGNNNAPKFSRMVNDHLKGDSLRGLVAAALGCAAKVSEAPAVYVWSASLAEGFAVYAAMEEAGFKVQSQIIWRKTPFVMGRCDYHWQHEVCWYGFKPSGHPWYGGRTESSVWDVPKLASMDAHPTMKPPALAERALRNSSVAGDVVLDLFLGSGSTMVAAEQLGRRCYGMEIEPKYCAVILERMSTMGLTPRMEAAHGATAR